VEQLFWLLGSLFSIDMGNVLAVIMQGHLLAIGSQVVNYWTGGVYKFEAKLLLHSTDQSHLKLVQMDAMLGGKI
jgi:hypothetical protein